MISIGKLKNKIYSIILQQIIYNSENEDTYNKREFDIRKPMKEM